MANFKTHLVVAATASGTASVILLSLKLATPWETGAYFLLGVLGGLLPDIDADRSTPLTLIFSMLSLYCAFAMVFNLVPKYSFIELFILWGAIYWAIRYAILEMVIRITIHRGVFHSLLAVAFMTLLTTDACYHLLQKPAAIAWNAGAFIGAGYLVHLTLDELFSVDLQNKRIKSSFGTALKLFSIKNGSASLLMLAVLCVFIQYAPPLKNYWQTVNRALVAHDLQEKWLPKHKQLFKDLL